MVPLDRGGNQTLVEGLDVISVATLAEALEAGSHERGRYLWGGLNRTSRLLVSIAS